MPEYIAPETVLGWARNAAADWWSFGALVYFMVFGMVSLPVCDLLTSTGIPFWEIRYDKYHRLYLRSDCQICDSFGFSPFYKSHSKRFDFQGKCCHRVERNPADL